MYVKTYKDFLASNVTISQTTNESSKYTDWNNMKFESSNEREVADVVEQTLMTKNLLVIEKGSDEFSKMEQHSSTEGGEKVLEITGNDLTLYTVPCEFIKWDKEIESDPTFIIRGEDYTKI